MKRGLLLFLILSFFTTLDAQYRWDWGVHLGASNYLGDIGGKDQPRRDFISDVKLDQTRYVFGGHIRYKASRSAGITASIMYGRVQGWDENTEYGPRRARNLNFRNNLLEFTIRGEYTLYSDNDLGGQGYYNPDFKLYAFVGIGAVMHNPKGYLGENQYDLKEGWYDLRELKTEGQASEYGKFTYTIPMGVGAYITHNKRYRFGWELGYRITGTDYLDDISGYYASNDQLESNLAIAIANQTTPEIIEETFGNPAEIYNYHYTSDIQGGGTNPRGINDNNDGYIFTTLSAGMMIKQNSKYSKAKYNWYKKRKRSKRARAKF